MQPQKHLSRLIFGIVPGKTPKDGLLPDRRLPDDDREFWVEPEFDELTAEEMSLWIGGEKPAIPDRNQGDIEE